LAFGTFLLYPPPGVAPRRFATIPEGLGFQDASKTVPYCVGDWRFGVIGRMAVFEERALAATPGQEITYTAATPGSGGRVVFRARPTGRRLLN
jgi:hypothetical protein